MEYSVVPINWNNNDELLFGNTTNAGEEIFPMSYAKEKNKGPIPMIFLAKNQDNKLIGRAILGLFDEEKEGEYFVKGISHHEPSLFGVFVDEEYRNHGIGKKLVDVSIQYCRDNGFSFISLDTNTAAEFYKKNWGFQFSHSVEWYNPLTKEIEILDIFILKL